MQQTPAKSASSSDDDWETSDFSNVAQTRLANPLTGNEAAIQQLRSNAPTFQPRTIKPPSPKIWEPQPPSAPPSTSLSSKTTRISSGTGRSVLAGPGAIDRKDDWESDNGVFASSSIDTITNNNVNSSRSISEIGSRSSSAAPILSKRRSDPQKENQGSQRPTQNPPSVSDRGNPFGDDEEWGRDPRTMPVSNTQVWDEANAAVSAPIPLLTKNVLPSTSFRILRRSSPATTSSSSSRDLGSNHPSTPVQPGHTPSGSRSGSQRGKTLPEREEEYRRARERIFGKEEAAGLDDSPADNRSEISVGGSASGATTPAQSNGSTGSGPSFTSQPTAAQLNAAGVQIGRTASSVSNVTSASSSTRGRNVPPQAQTGKRRNESHFEPLRPPTQLQPPLSSPVVPGYPRGPSRDRFNANGYGPQGTYQSFETAPYGMGLSGGMPYAGTMQQQLVGQGGNFQQQQPQPQQQTGFSQSGPLYPGYRGGNGNGFGGPGMNSSSGGGPMRQPIGPGDVDGMGFGQLRVSEAPNYAGGHALGPGQLADWSGSRPSYSSSSSSSSSDISSAGPGGYPYSGGMGYQPEMNYRPSNPHNNLSVGMGYNGQPSPAFQQQQQPQLHQIQQQQYHSQQYHQNHQSLQQIHEQPQLGYVGGYGLQPARHSKSRSGSINGTGVTSGNLTQRGGQIWQPPRNGGSEYGGSGEGRT